MTESHIHARTSRTYPQWLWGRWLAARFFDPPPRRTWSTGLRRLRVFGLLALAVELLIFCWWGSLQIRRFDLTTDFAAYYQPTYLIAHGHLNPYSTLWHFSFWRNDGEFIFWLLAIPVRLWTHFDTLKWIQALAMVAAQAVAFGWICEIAAAHEADRRESVAPIVLTAFGLLLLLANPWFFRSVSFDLHSEVFAAPFVIAVARDSYRGRLARAWVWALVACGCGAVSASYVAAVGLSLVLCGRRWRRQGMALALVGLVWQMVLRGVGATGGSEIVPLYWQFFETSHHTLPRHASLPQFVAAVATHPGKAVSTAWGNRGNLCATVLPPGLIGLFWRPALVPSVLVLTEGALVLYAGFSLPSFQNIVIAPLIAIGTVTLLLGMVTRTCDLKRRVGYLGVALLASNAVLWGAVWIPRIAGAWSSVPKASAHVLAEVRREIGPNDQVIVSQGVVGGFGNRKYVYHVLTYPTGYPVESRRVWIILLPKIGIETTPRGQTPAVIVNLLRLPGMRLLVSREGVRVLRWDVPAGVKRLSLTANR